MEVTWRLASFGVGHLADMFDCCFAGVIEKKSLKSLRRCIMAGLEGQKAPAFTLAGSDGKQHSLSEYAGKNVILWFYPKDDTPG
jgi:hypothetical protein